MRLIIRINNVRMIVMHGRKKGKKSEYCKMTGIDRVFNHNSKYQWSQISNQKIQSSRTDKKTSRTNTPSPIKQTRIYLFAPSKKYTSPKPQKLSQGERKESHPQQWTQETRVGVTAQNLTNQNSNQMRKDNEGHCILIKGITH